MDLRQAKIYFQDGAGRLRPLRWLGEHNLPTFAPDIYRSGTKQVHKGNHKKGIALLLVAAICGISDAQRELALLFSRGHDISCDFIPSYQGINWWLGDADLAGLEQDMLANAIRMQQTAQPYTENVRYDYRCSDTIKLLAHGHYHPAISLAGEVFFFGIGSVQDRALGLAWAMLSNRLNLEGAAQQLDSMRAVINRDVSLAATSLFSEILSEYLSGTPDRRRLTLHG